MLLATDGHMAAVIDATKFAHLYEIRDCRHCGILGKLRARWFMRIA